ncbi:MAG: glycoside hydrolase family 31 protein [Bacilli bacterium]
METNKEINKGVFKGDKYRISVLSPSLLRLEYNENKVFCDYPTLLVYNRNFSECEFKVKEDNKYLYIETTFFKLEYIKNSPFKGRALMPDSNLKVSINGEDKSWYYNHPEARNYKGNIYSLDNDKESSINNGLFSTDGFVSIDDSNRLIYNDGSVLKNPNNGLDIYLFVYKKDFNRCLSDYYLLTSYPPLIPRYAFGVWWNKEEDYNLKDIENINKEFIKNNIPHSVMLMGKYLLSDEKTNYSINKSYIESLMKLSTLLHSSNICLGVNINPMKDITTNEDMYEEIYNYLNLETRSNISINAYNKNNINAFIKYIINYYIENGVDFIGLDEEVFDNKEKMFIINNYIVNNYSSFNKRPMSFARNYGIASHRYPVMYSGKTIVGWETLKKLPYLCLTSANAGSNIWSHDIGGFKDGSEDSELYIRYIQFGVYSPIFRLASDKGVYYKREPWKWDVKTLNIVKDYTRIRHKLVPYLYSENYKYSKKGIALIRPLYYEYADIYYEPLYNEEYYFGSELLVCPITSKKDIIMDRVVQRLYIPKGTYYDYKTGKKFPGDKRYVTFYKDEDYPVFAKSGSIIPMSIINNDNLNDISSPTNMEIQIFPGQSNSYNLYEDDGISNLYKDGYYIVTNIDYNYRESNYTLIIRPVEGKSGIIPSVRNYKIKFRNTKYAQNVIVNINDYKVDHEKYVHDNDFIVEVKGVPTTGQLTINCKGNDIEVDATRAADEEINEIISGLKIKTSLKTKIYSIIFSGDDIKKKRIKIKNLKRSGLDEVFIRMFIKLLEYMAEI